MIEDQELNRKVVRIVLQSKGVYSRGKRLMLRKHSQVLEDAIPQLILMDIALPGQSGEDLTRRIKANLAWVDIPIIALTAAAMSGDRERILKAGCDDYLSKPIDIKVFGWERVETHINEDKQMNEEVISERQEGAKILVVDDEPKNVKILQIQLNARGYTVYTAADGLEALDAVEKRDGQNLILLDINMPRMDGFEVVKRIRANEATEFIPIVMITALRDTRENRIKSIEAGAR